MHPDSAAAALIAASLMWLPVMMIAVPRFAAAVHQLLFVLLCLFALVVRRFLVHIVHVVCKDLAESVDCMFVDQFVVDPGSLAILRAWHHRRFLPLTMQPGQHLFASF